MGLGVPPGGPFKDPRGSVGPGEVGRSSWTAKGVREVRTGWLALPYSHEGPERVGRPSSMAGRAWGAVRRIRWGWEGRRSPGVPPGWLEGSGGPSGGPGGVGVLPGGPGGLGGPPVGPGGVGGPSKESSGVGWGGSSGEPGGVGRGQEWLGVPPRGLEVVRRPSRKGWEESGCLFGGPGGVERPF